MSAPVAICAWITLVLLAHALCEQTTISRKWPMRLLCIGLGVLFFEWTRFDHGYGTAWFAVAFLGAPIAAIFGGALWGVRRFYGWPDLGPLPGRLAAASAAVLLGVLLGTQVRDRHDVPESRRRAEAMREQVLRWRQENLGQWPTSLEEAVPEPASTAMGWFLPPPFEYREEAGSAFLSLPMPRGRRLALDLATGGFGEAPR